jgi:hemerythrin superfamily protein
MPKKKSSTTSKSDAIAMLKEDHKKVLSLLADLERTTERGANKRQKLVDQIEREIKVHSKLEEEIFYPAFRDAVSKKEDKQLYYESTEEHHLVDMVLAEIKEADLSSEIFEAKGKVLKDLIEHHAKEEEEKIMFAKAKKAMGREELQELGQRMEERKEELMSGELSDNGSAKYRSSTSGRSAAASR